MSHALLQKDLTPPPREALQRAFRAVEFLTEMDAHTVLRDAFGILVKNLTPENAAALQGALRVEDVETEIVEQRLLPPMPPTKFVQRLDCLAEGLQVYDPLGRGFRIEWRHLVLIAAGEVRVTEFNTYQVERRAVAGSRQHNRYLDTNTVSETVTREELNSRLLLELVLTRGVQRFSVTADKFNYAYLGSRRTPSVPENFTLLVRDLAQFAPHAALNRGAFFLREEPAQLFSYPSKNAFFEEILWLLWRMQQAGTPGCAATMQSERGHPGRTT